MIVISEKVDCMCGNVDMLKDSFISHVVLVLASQVIGITKIYDIAFNDNIMLTIKSLNLLGVKVRYNKMSKICTVEGVGVGGFICPKDILYLRQPSIYMIMGCLSNCPFISFLCGDNNLNISKVINPLILMGAKFISNNNSLPIALIGCVDMLPIRYVARAEEVKLALLFAALNTCGTTTIVDTVGQDRIIPVLQHFNVAVEYLIDKNLIIRVFGQRELYFKDICIPHDFFSMLSFITTALILRNSNIMILSVLLDDKIKKIYEILIKMGGNIFFVNKRKNIIGEEIVDLLVKSSILQGLGHLISDNFDIDEYLFMMIISACANGITIFSDLLNRGFIDKRLNLIINVLIKCGVNIETKNNDLIIYGCSGNVLGGILVDACYDFKITVLFLIIGMISDNYIKIKNIRKTSDFVSIIELFNKHGAKIRIV